MIFGRSSKRNLTISHTTLIPQMLSYKNPLYSTSLTLENLFSILRSQFIAPAGGHIQSGVPNTDCGLAKAALNKHATKTNFLFSAEVSPGWLWRSCRQHGNSKLPQKECHPQLLPALQHPSKPQVNMRLSDPSEKYRDRSPQSIQRKPRGGRRRSAGCMRPVA